MTKLERIGKEGLYYEGKEGLVATDGGMMVYKKGERKKEVFKGEKKSDFFSKYKKVIEKGKGEVMKGFIEMNDLSIALKAIRRRNEEIYFNVRSEWEGAILLSSPGHEDFMSGYVPAEKCSTVERFNVFVDPFYLKMFPPEDGLLFIRESLIEYVTKYKGEELEVMVGQMVYGRKEEEKCESEYLMYKEWNKEGK